MQALLIFGLVVAGLVLAGAGYYLGAHRLQVPAVHDPVTGLFTEAAFQALLKRETARARRYGGCFSLVKFVSVAPVEETALYLKHNFRDSDIIAQLHGRQLVMLLPETDEAGARVCARKVQEHCNVRNLVFITGPEGEEKPEEVLQRLERTGHKRLAGGASKIEITAVHGSNDEL